MNKLKFNIIKIYRQRREMKLRKYCAELAMKFIDDSYSFHELADDIYNYITNHKAVSAHHQPDKGQSSALNRKHTESLSDSPPLE